MYRMATEFAFPHTVTKRRLSPQLFQTQSTDEKAWIAPIRAEVFSVYKRVNEAIAKGDEKTLKQITAYEFQQRAMELARRKSLYDAFKVWTLHSEVSPCRILSLRALPAHHGRQEPKTGNRLAVQVLARFETLQSLQLYNKRGQRLRPDGSVASPDEPPPSPKRVLEYMVLENKMYYPDGWVIRGQIFEGVQGRFKDIEN